MLRTILLLLCGLTLLSLTVACQPEQNSAVQFGGSTMGTTWSVNLHSLPAGTNVANLKQRLQKRLDQINALMSTYDPTSEVSRFNIQTSSDWIAISAETAQVVELALQISELTDGAFDISVGPLVELWGFGAAKRAEQIPNNTQIEEQLAKVGYQKLQLRRQPAALKKQHPQLRIDLSAIAKGYAVDVLAELLNQQGIDNYLVEIGGELQISGQRTDKTPWRIAIEKPLEGTREVATIFALTDTALATSGNYRNYFVENGQRYVHTLNPVSGQPIRHKLASVTVLDPNCARADALATALMVMGEERGRLLVEKKGIAAYFLLHEKNATIEYKSPAFADSIAKEDK